MFKSLTVLMMVLSFSLMAAAQEGNEPAPVAPTENAPLPPQEADPYATPAAPAANDMGTLPGTETEPIQKKKAGKKAKTKKETKKKSDKKTDKKKKDKKSKKAKSKKSKKAGN